MYKTIYVKDSAATFWERAERKAGKGNMSAYIARLIRNDIIRTAAETPLEKMERAIALMTEANRELSS